jgi:hypothetical protein
MDYAELLFAAAVRDLAITFQKNACPEEVINGTPSQMDGWFDANPLSNFIPDALREIEEIANQIKREKPRD